MMISSFVNLLGTAFLFCSLRLVESDTTHGIVDGAGEVRPFAVVERHWKSLAKLGLGLNGLGFAIQVFLYWWGSN